MAFDRENKREYDRKYRATHRAQINESVRRWELANPEKAERRRRWGKLHPKRNAANAAKWRAANLKKAKWFAKRSFLKTLYGISLEEYQEMLSRQDYACAICRSPFAEFGSEKKTESPYVDHDHETRVVRGLLCHHCNLGIGNFKNSPNRLLVAAEYLRKHDRRSFWKASAEWFKKAPPAYLARPDGLE